MIKVADLRNKTKEDLMKELDSVEKEIQKVVFDVLQKKEKNTKKTRNLRKDVARLKTLLKEKVGEEGSSKNNI